MHESDKAGLSEQDICTKFITPALTDAGWNLQTQIREQVNITKGRVVVKGDKVSRDAEEVCRIVTAYLDHGTKGTVE